MMVTRCQTSLSRNQISRVILISVVVLVVGEVLTTVVVADVVALMVEIEIVVGLLIFSAKYVCTMVPLSHTIINDMTNIINQIQLCKSVSAQFQFRLWSK